jgi:hypothetical protein
MRRLSSSLLILSAGALAYAAGFVFPAPTVAQPPVETIRFVIHPAAAPVPALKYELLPSAEEITPGNAVQTYYRAFSPEWFTLGRDTKTYEQISDSLATPLKDLPRESWVLNSHQLREVDLAARREYCDWQFTERIKKEGIGLLLPDVQSLRQFAVLLAYRARLQIAAGQYDQAIYTLRTGMAMGRHVAEAPTFINALVGVAISQLMLKQFEDLIQAPNAPNLYWALSELPVPYINLRSSMQAEKIFLQATIPLLKDIGTTPWTAQQQTTIREQLRFLEGRDDFGTTALALMKFYPEAKHALIAQGRKPDEIEAMPVIQVVLLRSFQQYEDLRDDLFKWVPLPYWQARQGIEEVTLRIDKTRQSLEGIPLSSVLPAIGKVSAATASLDRRIAALRCVEATRLYAAAHEGKLPATLADIKEVPVPDDPMTGKPFEYKLDGDKAILSGSVPPGLGNNYGLRFELTIAR